jgi:hypothetical protein
VSAVGSLTTVGTLAIWMPCDVHAATSTVRESSVSIAREEKCEAVKAWRNEAEEAKRADEGEKERQTHRHRIQLRSKRRT